MDQVKIGKFILEKRKEMGLTQQELADLISISNKTVSKWECGKGMPEVGLMLPLCNSLKITVNELLTGEILNSSYQEKAEENLIDLIEEKEREKISSPTVLIVQGIALICSIALWLLLFADSNVYQLGHYPTPRTLSYLIVGFVSIYSVITIISYGIIRKSSILVFMALSFASFVCLLICWGYGTLWLVLPAMAGMVLCFCLSVFCYLKIRKNHR